MLAPLAAVLLFLAAIVAAFGYLRLEEIEREQEAVRRDVEYAQQRLRLHLVEHQEQLARLAQEISARDILPEQFRERAQNTIAQYLDLQSLVWIGPRKTIVSSYASPSQSVSLRTGQIRHVGVASRPKEIESIYALAHDIQQPAYLQRNAPDGMPMLQLLIPVYWRSEFNGVLLAEYSVDSLYRYSLPSEVLARYAVSLLDSNGVVLAGTSIPKRSTVQWLPWTTQANEFEAPVSPVGNELVIRAQAYSTSLGVIGSGLFWLVCALSVMTAWMLIGNWRHTRRRMQAQQALISETNFRRAMENSMPTGMRALDLQGRITYVNAAFCKMTGWSESELVGRTAPFPYWPDEDKEILRQRLDEELNGQVAASGLQMRVKRKNGSIFDARIYISPLIDAVGKQTGWMTSITDITEPNRVREQLTASYERFTTVLESLDASVAVAPIGSDELLFANKMYRQWFSEKTNGLVQLASQVVMPAQTHRDDAGDNVDALMGMPTSNLPDIETERAEIFVEELGKWLEVRTRYLTWVDGRLAQMVIATDITARRLAEEQSAAQTERAQTASRLITMGEMASSVAHELNQPLTAITNYCNGMVSRIHSKQMTEPDLLAALEKTGRQAQRAGQIIQRIRAFVKRSEPNWVLSDVAVMVDEALELVEADMRRANVRLRHQVARNLPPIQVDPILIEQVLVNLLKNAAESIAQANRPPERRSVDMWVHAAEVEGKPVVEFSVRDTGRGIAPEAMERLYEAFFTTKPEGMGIGLSLCRSIVESHQGRMRAENLYNGTEVAGCCFAFWIPLPVTASMGTPLPSNQTGSQV